MQELIEQALSRGKSVKQEEAKYDFKPVKRLKISETQDFCTYSIKDFSLFDSFSTRTDQLEAVLEKNLSLRMKKFLPSNFDLVDYDREMLKK